MKGIFFIACIGCLQMVTGCSNGKTNSSADGQAGDSAAVSYDSTLADKLGADRYGMRTYVMALLKAGPHRDQPKEEARNIQKAHLDYISSLSQSGKLVVAGPMLDDGEIRGIFIFNVPNLIEAEALTQADPAVKSGRLVMELHPWYGSASLLMIREWHEQIAQVKP